MSASQGVFESDHPCLVALLPLALLVHSAKTRLLIVSADPNGAPARATPSPNGKPDEIPATEEVPIPNKAKAPSANDLRNVVRRKLTGYVGFANLPNQWHRKSVRKGFNFNVMVVGALISFFRRPTDANGRR
jgi:hypothetical protein